MFFTIERFHFLHFLPPAVVDALGWTDCQKFHISCLHQNYTFDMILPLDTLSSSVIPPMAWYDLAEDVFNPGSIVQDMIADDSAGWHLLARQRYTAEKETLIYKFVTTSAGNSWTVCRDIPKSEVIGDGESEQPVGVKKLCSLVAIPARNRPV